MNKNIPDIRFKGFTEEWEECELSQLVDLQSGRDYKHLLNGHIPVYGTGGYMLSVNEALSYKEDAVGIGRKGTIDKPYILNAPFWTVDTLFYSLPKGKNNLNFIYDIFQKINWRQKDESTGVPSLSKVAINGIKIFTTTPKEQTKIGNYFKTLDQLITQQQQKYDKLISIKKAMLKKMFPQNGANVPEIRFKGFTEDWVEKEFNKMCWFQEGPGLRNWQFTNQGIKVINITNLENGFLNLERTDRHISLKEFNKMYQHFEIDEQDIVVASSGNSYGKVAVVRKQDLPLLMNTSVIRFKPFKGLDYEYLLNFLKSNQFKNQIDLLITGGAQPNFGPVHLNKIKISLPSNINEQIKIGSYFKNLYSLISLYEKEIEKLKNIKKAFLDKMFV